MSDAPEFSRPFDLRGITIKPVALTANEAERAALARRFDIVSIASLTAELSLEAKGADVHAKGTLSCRSGAKLRGIGRGLAAVFARSD